MEKIKTSVIIPVYNTAEYLEECIDSVLAQTQKEIEIFLVDDGSTDGSLDIIDRYAARYPFIYKLTQEHAYQGTARNRGLEQARGEYVYFMDSDDAILPELFETCYEACERMKLDYATFDAYGFRYDENDVELKVPDDIFDRTTLDIEDRVYSGPEFWNAFYNRHGILYLCWLHYIRRDFLLKHRLTYEERTYFEDNDWTLRLYMAAERLYFIPRQLHRHRWRRGSNMLEGFTLGLLQGCFRMHDVLLGLYRDETDEARLKMISDVIRLNICRFDRLEEVDPSRGYLEPLQDFCGHLGEAMLRETAEALYCVHFAAAERILRAVRSWEDRAVFDRLSEIAGQTFSARYPVLRRKKTVAVYGTGEVSRVIAELLDKYLPERACRLIFVHTAQKTGTEFCGYPVYNVADAPAERPDVIVVGSVVFADSILQKIREYFPADQPVYLVPREVKFLQDNRRDFAGMRVTRRTVTARKPSLWEAREAVTVWGLSYSVRWLFGAFPSLREKVRAFVAERAGTEAFCGIPVRSPRQAEAEGLLAGQVVVCFGDLDRRGAQDLLDTVRGYGVPQERILTAAQFVREYLALWEPVAYTPSAVNLEACSLCQLNCAGCYMRLENSGTVGKGRLSFADFERFLADNPMIRTIELSDNGEVFLNPELHGILSLCKERGIAVQMLNGVNFNHVPEQVMEDLVRCGVRQILVSIDGATQETYEKYRRGGSLAKVLENIEKLNEWKKTYGSAYPVLHWQFILMNENQHEAGAAAQLAKELGMKICFKQDWRGGFRAKDPQELFRITGMRCFDGADYMQQEKHTYASDQYCRQMLLSPQINWDGRLLGCCTTYRSDWGINVFRTPLREIYNDPDYRAAIISLLAGADGRDHMGPCRDCGAYRVNVCEMHRPLQL